MRQVQRRRDPESSLKLNFILSREYLNDDLRCQTRTPDVLTTTDRVFALTILELSSAETHFLTRTSSGIFADPHPLRILQSRHAVLSSDRLR